MLPRRFLLKSRRQSFLAIALAGGTIMLSVMLSIGGVSCREPTQEGWVADGVIGAGEYTGQASYGDYEIHWDSDGQYIYIGMKAEDSGWVAVGFQPGPLHRETDMVIGFVEGGRASVFDMFSSASLGPCATDSELGGSDDILEYGGREEGGYTVIEFKRLLSTGDSYDGELFSGANEIIWAHSPLDDPRLGHTRQGRGEIGL
jgi:hypothetical protein